MHLKFLLTIFYFSSYLCYQKYSVGGIIPCKRPKPTASPPHHSPRSAISARPNSAARSASVAREPRWGGDVAPPVRVPLSPFARRDADRKRGLLVRGEHVRRCQSGRRRRGAPRRRLLSPAAAPARAGRRRGPDTAPRQVPADHGALLSGHTIQHDDHAESAEPPEAGGRRSRGASVLSAGQGQVQPGPPVLPVLRLHPGLHDPGPAAAALQVGRVGWFGIGPSMQSNVQLKSYLRTPFCYVWFFVTPMKKLSVCGEQAFVYNVQIGHVQVQVRICCSLTVFF